MCLSVFHCVLKSSMKMGTDLNIWYLNDVCLWRWVGSSDKMFATVRTMIEELGRRSLSVNRPKCKLWLINHLTSHVQTTKLFVDSVPSIVIPPSSTWYVFGAPVIELAFEFIFRSKMAKFVQLKKKT